MDNIKFTIGIIGLGLIGGSISKSLIKKGYIVHGFDNDHETNKLASSDGVIIHHTVVDLIKNCNLVFIGTEQNSIIKICEIINTHCDRNLVVCDVGSVKSSFYDFSLRRADNKNVRWIGTHPLAGTEFSGYKNSKDNLFNQSIWAIEINEKNELSDIFNVSQVLITLGSNILFLNHQEHDDTIARTSHIPYIMSAAVSIIASRSKSNNLAINLSAGSLRDLTRISGSNPLFSTKLIYSNKEFLLPILKNTINILTEFYTNLLNDDIQSIIEYFTNGKEFRSLLIESNNTKMFNCKIDITNEKDIKNNLLARCKEGMIISDIEWVNESTIEITTKNIG